MKKFSTSLILMFLVAALALPVMAAEVPAPLDTGQLVSLSLHTYFVHPFAGALANCQNQYVSEDANYFASTERDVFSANVPSEYAIELRMARNTTVVTQRTRAVQFINSTFNHYDTPTAVLDIDRVKRNSVHWRAVKSI